MRTPTRTVSDEADPQQTLSNSASMYCHETMLRNGFLKETSRAALTTLAIDGCSPIFLWIQSSLRSGCNADFSKVRIGSPPKAGTPARRIVSPTLANLALDGLEALLTKMFSPCQEKGRWVHPKVHLVRYADDFIITGDSHELLVNEVRPLVEAFLRERGLELSVEKTHVTRIQDGFDFLGQHLRKYGGKLLVTPSKKNTQAFLTKVREVIEKNKSATQANLIVQLNPLICGWANYHRHCVASRAFGRVDFEIWRKLWRWCRRRHPRKNASWLKARYFHTSGGRTWTFATLTPAQTPPNQPIWKQLTYAGDTPIRRHRKIRGDANPYDPDWRSYFAERANRQPFGKRITQS
jgi:RNA-directed DNA polymerase